MSKSSEPFNKKGVVTMSKEFLTAVQDRRSYYGISKESTVSDTRIEEVIGHAVKHTPSPFNSQSARVILLLGNNQNRLWDIAKESLRKIVPAPQFSVTEEKINSFRNGYGSVLFFEDQSVVKGLQEKFPLYAANFPVWSEQSSGMLQYVIWTALEIEGLGASLQHYAAVIEPEVKKEWNVPQEWKLIAQMPFGKPIAQPGEKEFKPLHERLKVFK